WTASSKLVILITGTGTRNAESFEGLSSGAPLLHVEYTTTIQIASAKSGTIQETTAQQTVTKDISEEGILVYPNPVHNVLTVKFDEKTEVERILVYSITGSLVKEIKVNKVMSETQVDCSNFVPGTYLLKLSSSKGGYSMQFIKQ
ncbi:MAG TPA: T9SS type A sorting domain-containing protein, partial [Draconibacterium sp.]|nr:T9SS type A sorting domain-containing protein [Draconibacterium sp.]